MDSKFLDPIAGSNIAVAGDVAEVVVVDHDNPSEEDLALDTPWALPHMVADGPVACPSAAVEVAEGHNHPGNYWRPQLLVLPQNWAERARQIDWDRPQFS